jgi:peptide deformylase
MARLQIAVYPAPVLRKKALPVERVTPEMRAFLDAMADAMYDDNGVGLAAPQVGISLRIVVVDTDDKLVPLINPQIIASDGTQTGPEGCLSLPNLHATVTRAMRVTVRGINDRGKPVTLSGEGLWARAIQHELDHLDGVLFIDRAEPDSFVWVTGERDADGHVIERPTSLDDALRVFEGRTALRA